MNRKMLQIKFLSIAVLCSLLICTVAFAQNITVYENQFTETPGSEWTFQGSLSEQNHAVYNPSSGAIEITNKSPYAVRTTRVTFDNALKDDSTVIKLTVTPLNTNGVSHTRAKVKFYDGKNVISHQIFLSVDASQNFGPTNTSSTMLTKSKVAVDFSSQVIIEMECKFSDKTARYRIAKSGENYTDWSDYKAMQADNGADTEIKSILFSNEYMDCNLQINEIVVNAPKPKYPPEARNINISGFEKVPQIGNTLKGEYDYYSEQDDAEADTRIRWYRTETASGVNDADMVSEGESEYTVTEADNGKYIWFEVLPRSVAEPSEGDAVRKMLSMRYAIDIENDINALNMPEETDKNIQLPNKGQNGSDISWTSSNMAVINTDGTVKAANSDTIVILTATVSNSGISKSKNFEVLVKGLRVVDEEGNPINLALNKDIVKTNLLYNSPSALEAGGRAYMYLNDGTTQTSMRSSYGGTFDFTIDLGKVYSINKCVTKELQTSGNYAISSYTIEGSTDNVSYFPVVSDGEKVGSAKIDEFDSLQIRYIKFTQTGTSFLAEGSSKGLPTIIGEFEVYSVPYAPEIVGGVEIVSDSGDEIRVGDCLTAQYTYSDKNGDAEQDSEINWLISDTENFENSIIVGNGEKYTVTENDMWKYIKAEVTPKNASEPPEGEKKASRAYGFIKPSVDAMIPPTALGISVSGYLYSGRTLKGEYIYYDNKQNPEKDSVIRWLSSKDKDTGFKVIKEGKSNDEDILTLKISDLEISKYIKFEVTPISSEETGTPAFVITEKVEKDPAQIDLDSIVLPEKTSTDIVLPLSGKNGSTISWASSNSSIIGTDGTVKRGNKSETVILTAFAKLYGEALEKQYTVTVPASENSYGGGASGSGRTVITSDGVSVPNIVNFKTQYFDDVEADFWANDYIEKLAKKNIISGTGNGKFEPEKAVTREEFVKMIVTAFGFKSNGFTSDFSDVARGQWYTGYIDIANEYGLINGISEDTFGIASPITRADLSVIISRAVEKKGIMLDNTTESAEFDDADTIPAYALSAVLKLQKAEILSGMGNNMFMPLKEATRAEVAKIICLLLNEQTY